MVQTRIPTKDRVRLLSKCDWNAPEKTFVAQNVVETARKEALGDAVAKARAEAQLLAAAIGVQLGVAVPIRIANKMPNSPQEAYVIGYCSRAPNPDKETVYVDVEVEFEQDPIEAQAG